MRIATYNVEWFANLFDRRGRLLADDEWSARYKVTRAQQLGALGIVFTAVNADAVLVVEAPDNNSRRKTVPMLEGFAAEFGLRQRRTLIGFSNDTQQEIALMYDPDVITATHDPRGGEGASPRFDQSLRIDLDIDATLDTVTFSKPPLEVALETKSGETLRLIGVHIKSKAPHAAPSPEAATRIAIENRRKQLAQCIWLRQRVDEHLDAGERLIVLGDFNDGPGLDEYEQLFGRSGLEIVAGEGGPPERRMRDPHARLSHRHHSTAAQPSSARFYLADEKQYFSAMLDYIMLSPDLCATGPKWRIWHPFDDPVCYRTPELREALLQASDHFPVTVDISL
ncbi:endonuclease/exonuclease/phosphatase family protein [Paenirhodobacter sp. CAU 1674]|jgi:endonuclease/exonuclease/phosphatase family metal-dependent hydrolase|uniref:endonuclease/exonuclease/phosphatase family protein n=1 Tax=Paenirhodobacter sp. CAU 1674 TaxID=3032596 RepID=UPI0023DA3230|nr:endonuclease/exonuclease/phosphatase family protein [Paenirhodobacter sp. CAU 1674]MDF2140275.1 endonuclease [Paenirhodobacter sp. CAU 1674]